jgi:hypothetical protein
MKKSKLIYALSLLSLNLSGVYGTTKLLIRAQDDETAGGVKIPLSIPQVIYDGPEGDGIKIIDRGNQIAVKDKQGSFLVYEDVDRRGNIAPHIFLTSLEFKGRQQYAVATQGRRTLKLKVYEDDSQQSFVKWKVGDNTYTYDIPNNIRSLGHFLYPVDLSPLNKEGLQLQTKSVDDMPFFDAVSVFGTIWSVFDMYSQDIKDLSHEKSKMRWNKRGKVRVFPRMTREQYASLYPGEDYDENITNAFYDYRKGDQEGEHVVCFFPVDEEEEKYTSQSSDVVSHEAGHNALNIVRPDLWESTSSDIKAFHETFGDMTALFLVLTFPEMREILLEKTGGNLHISSFLSVIGERIVDRDAAQCTDIAILPSCEEHELSERLTRALYGAFADLFNMKLKSKRLTERDRLLDKTAGTFRFNFLQATVGTKFTTFIDFGKALEATGKPLFQTLVHINFLRQGINLTGISSSPQICILQSDDQEEQKFLGCATSRMSRRKVGPISGLNSDA